MTQDGPEPIRAATARERSFPFWPAFRALVLVVMAASLFQNAAAPWTGMHDWNGAFYSLLAKNLMRYPLAVTHGLPVVAMGAQPPEPDVRSIYATHPPGLVYLVAASFVIFGEHEWSARLVPIACTLGSVWLLTGLAATSFGRVTALWAGLVFATMPLAAYFGRMVNHEPVCLFFMLLALWGASERGVLRWCAAVCGAVGAIWTGWPGVLLVGLLIGWLVWRGGPGRSSDPGSRFLPSVIGLTALSFAALVAMLSLLVYGGFEGRWGDLLAVMSARAGREMPMAAPLLGTPWTYTIENLTWPVLIAAVIGAWVWIRRWTPRSESTNDYRRAFRDCDWLVLLTLVGGAWLLLLWPQFKRHNYWQFYLAPVAAALAGLALSAFFGAMRRGMWHGVTRPATVLVGGLVLGAGLLGTSEYFARRAYSPYAVAYWQDFRGRYGDDAPVLLYRDPVRMESHGDRPYRNLVPPQEMYYMDRPFGVARDIEAVIAGVGRYAAFVVPIEAEPEVMHLLQALWPHFPYRLAYPYPYFEVALPPPGP
jgi:4-amino-4-deoxy-L-arabinose transferase-like glycosyltransferase